MFPISLDLPANRFPSYLQQAQGEEWKLGSKFDLLNKKRIAITHFLFALSLLSFDLSYN